MTTPATRALMDVLNGTDRQARFIGGCVRDAVLGRPIQDIDVATNQHPEVVIELAEAAGFRTIPTGLSHGTITVLVDGQPFEVTTLRLDVETDGRHARVAFTDDWQADAARRDFTMNAISMDTGGRLFDYFGGVPDARAGRVVFVGDPRTRLQEDRLRLFRFFRFHALYGDGHPDSAGLEACREEVSGISELSAERIRVELLKLLAADDPVPVWTDMVRMRVFEVLDLPVCGVDQLARFLVLEREYSVQFSKSRSLCRLAALAANGANAGTAQVLANRLRLSSAERDHLKHAFYVAMETPDSEASIRSLLYHCGVDTAVNGAMLVLSKSGNAGNHDLWRQLISTAETWVQPKFPLAGRDLLAVGLQPGPRMGEVLKQVENWWLVEAFRPDKDACLVEAVRLLEA